jgi:hypothetical protein
VSNKFGFGIIGDASTTGQQSQMANVLTALGALVEGRGLADGLPTFYVLAGVTVPSADAQGNPIQIEAEATAVLAFRSTTPRARLNALFLDALSKLPMVTSIESGDAANDADIERALRANLLNRGCDHYWSPIDRTTAVPTAPIALGQFAPLSRADT